MKRYKDLCPGKEAQLYALIAWNGEDENSAYEKVCQMSYDKLSELTHADDSIMTALYGIEKHMLFNVKTDLMEDLVRGDLSIGNSNYYELLGRSIESKCNGDMRIFYNTVLNIVSEIHDNWVKSNAQKYDRDKDNGDKRLFQHLPMELIGIEEVNKDLLFLSPLLDRFNLPVGIMTFEPYGSFNCTNDFEKAYYERVKSFLQSTAISDIDDLKDYLQNDVRYTYDALRPENAFAGQKEFAKARADYMKSDEKVDAMVEELLKKNKYLAYALNKEKDNSKEFEL